MIDPKMGWATTTDTAGIAHILRTTDGGSGWQDVTPPATNLDAAAEVNWLPASVNDFLDANDAWAIYWDDPNHPKQVWRTRDGGQTWEKSQPAATIGDDYGQPAVLQFLDARNGWLLMRYGACGTDGCDDVVLFATTDGGETWQRVVRTWEGGLSDCPKTGLAFASPQTAWLAGYCVAALVYLLQRTNDGGHAWHSQTLPAPTAEPNLLDFSQSAGCQANGPAFTSVLAGVLDMYCRWAKDYPVKRWLYFTTDGGQTWVPRQAPTDLGAAYFIDADIGWWLTSQEPPSPGPSRLYLTTDAGRTWTLIKQLAWSGTLDFISPQIGWAVAHAGDPVALVKTVDGGRTWQELKPHSN